MECKARINNNVFIHLVYCKLIFVYKIFYKSYLKTIYLIINKKI